MPYVTKTCQLCGKEYEKYVSPANPAERSRFCSRRCANIYLGRQQTIKATETRICPVCGEEYQTTNHHGGRKSCSYECARILQDKGRQKAIQARCKDKAQVVCVSCGKELLRYPSRIDGRKHFCNRACYATHLCHKVELICGICAQPFLVTRYFAYAKDGRRARYCSKECQAIIRSLKMRGEGNPNWNGGNSVNHYGSHWWKQRQKARDRDSYKCQACGSTKNLDVHHIVPAKTFDADCSVVNALSNLVCVCRRCHRRIERGKMPCPSPEI